MPKTASDPLFGTTIEPISAGRHAQVVTPSATDLPTVTSSLLITATAASSMTVIMANDFDSNPITIPLAAGTYQINIQVRAITVIAANATVIALWS